MASMIGIIYIIKAEIAFDPSGLNRLTLLAKTKNAHLAVTGYLYFERGQFIQYIEGRPEPVTQLMNSIKADCRHTVIHTEQVKVQTRKFPSWHMNYLPKKPLIELGLEVVMIQKLQFMKKIQSYSPLQRESQVLDMVDKLSQYRNFL